MRPDDLELRALDERVDVTGSGDRHGDPPGAAGERQEPDDQQQAELGRYGLAVLVDEQQPLGGPVEHDPEIRPHADDDAAGVDRLELPGPVVGVEPARADRLDAERAEDERQRERRGRVAVVDRDAEPAAPDGATSTESRMSCA